MVCCCGNKDVPVTVLRGCLCLAGDATEELMREKHVLKEEEVKKYQCFTRVNIIHISLRF